MIKVKTFATPIKIFATMRELHDLDAQVRRSSRRRVPTRSSP